jgi:hypothetical protein
MSWYLLRFKILSFIRGAVVTNNNGFWIRWLDLLALLYNYSQLAHTLNSFCTTCVWRISLKNLTAPTPLLLCFPHPLSKEETFQTHTPRCCYTLPLIPTPLPPLQRFHLSHSVMLVPFVCKVSQKRRILLTNSESVNLSRNKNRGINCRHLRS